MNSMNKAALHDAYAAGYDQQVSEYGCYIAEVLFGLSYEFTQPGQTLLDAGIGSGLAAALFAKAGLLVKGFDFSPAMLEICAAKGIASSLKEHDISVAPWPYPSAAFDHLACCGVLHFIPDLEVIFNEARRILRPDGLFAFTTKIPAALGESSNYDRQLSGDFEIYAHSPDYVEGMMRQFSFKPVKRQKCPVGDDMFEIWVTQRRSQHFSEQR
jgi:predicted TPR repeat methyltransferase